MAPYWGPYAWLGARFQVLREHSGASSVLSLAGACPLVVGSSHGSPSSQPLSTVCLCSQEPYSILALGHFLAPGSALLPFLPFPEAQIPCPLPSLRAGDSSLRGGTVSGTVSRAHVEALPVLMHVQSSELTPPLP